MNTHQTLPAVFTPHSSWIFSLMICDTEPSSWIFSSDKWIPVECKQSSRRIEFFEQQIIGQNKLGVIRFTALINAQIECTMLYLYNGEIFSHTLFYPSKQSEHTWWIESWKISHMLN